MIIRCETQEEVDKRKKQQENDEKIMLENRKVHFEYQEYSKFFTDHLYSNTKNYICASCRKRIQNNNVSIFGSDKLLDLYCLINGIYCTNCGSNSILHNQLDTKDELKKIVNENAFNNIYYLLGAKQNIGRLNLKQNQVNEIDLSEIGIDQDSIILDINYTPSGKYFPQELHGNNPRYKQKYDSNTVFVWPMELFNNPEITGSGVSVLVISVNKNCDIVQKRLLNAIDSYIDNDQNGLILNANIALEIQTNKICYKTFVKTKDEKDVEDFLKNTVYSYQLNYLLELICSTKKSVSISKEILNGMDLIRRRRNDIAHKGRLETKKHDELILTRDDMCETLSILIVGLSVLKHIENIE